MSRTEVGPYVLPLLPGTVEIIPINIDSTIFIEEVMNRTFYETELNWVHY